MKVGVWLKVHAIPVPDQEYLLARFNPIPVLFYSSFTFWACPVKFAHEVESCPNPNQESRSIARFMPTKLSKARFETDRFESKSTQQCVSTCVGIFQLVSASVSVSWLTLTGVSVFRQTSAGVLSFPACFGQCRSFLANFDQRMCSLANFGQFQCFPVSFDWYNMILAGSVCFLANLVVFRQGFW